MSSQNLEKALIESSIIRFWEQINECKKENMDIMKRISRTEKDINIEKNDVNDIQLTLLLDEYIKLVRSFTDGLDKLIESKDHKEIRLAKDKMTSWNERSAKVVKLLTSLMCTPAE